LRPEETLLIPERYRGG